MAQRINRSAIPDALKNIDSPAESPSSPHRGSIKMLAGVTPCESSHTNKGRPMKTQPKPSAISEALTGSFSTKQAAPSTTSAAIIDALPTKQRKSSAVPDALRNFDYFPDSANVRQPVVQALVGCSSATVWRMVHRGTLPAPRKLSERVTAWNVGELRQALSLK